MSAFLDPLLLRSLSIAELAKAGDVTTQLYEVMADFRYQSDKLGLTITVQAGLVTDFASIPRAAWALIDPEDPRIGWPSVVHDCLYSHMGTLPDGTTYTREQADSVLREAMEVQGAESPLRNAVYQAVQFFGGSHWNSN